MKKYILTDSGKEVQVGNIIRVSVKATDELIKQLVDIGIIKEKEYYPTDINYYIKKAAKLFDIEFGDMDTMLEVFTEKMPLVAIQMVLKVISLEMTKNVNFSKLNGVWGINLYDGKVFKLDKCNNFRIAWFDSEKKAEFARRIMKPFFEEIYGKQENS